MLCGNNAPIKGLDNIFIVAFSNRLHADKVHRASNLLSHNLAKSECLTVQLCSNLFSSKVVQNRSVTQPSTVNVDNECQVYVHSVIYSVCSKCQGAEKPQINPGDTNLS